MSKLLAVMFIYLSLCASFHFVEASSETWSETLSKTVARSAVTYVGSMICGPLCGVGAGVAFTFYEKGEVNVKDELFDIATDFATDYALDYAWDYVASTWRYTKEQKRRATGSKD